MKNPFEYWHVVGEDSFCDRRKELADLSRLIENGGRAFIYSERRFGKTSLIKLALSRLPKREFVPIYIDLWPTDSSASFVTTVAKALAESLSTSLERVVDLSKQFFSQLRPSITLDEQGNPSLTFSVAKTTRLEPEIEEVLAAPEKVGAKGKRVVIAFDEFQQILVYGRDDIERRLRSVVQHQQNAVYIFLGSRKHLIREMFLKASKPLYRSAAQFPLGPILEDDWRPFIRERFRKGEKNINNREIHSVIELTQGHPFYTQYLCHNLWERCEPNGYVTDELVRSALDDVLAREHHAYAIQWESLTLNQQRFLKALAMEEKGAKPFSADFLQNHHLGSPSSAQRVIKVLLNKDIVDQENGSFIILDRFFRLWIRRLHANQ